MDAQVYFHDDIAIPNALDKEQAIELAHDFVQNTLAVNGIFCDAAIHWDEGNHHLHVLMPLRALTDTGFGKKIRRSQQKFSKEVKRIREAWAVAATRHTESLTIHASSDDFVDLAHLRASVSRHGLNDIVADFPVAFSERRGFDAEKSSKVASSLVQKSKARIFDAMAYLFNHQEAVEQGQSAYDLDVAEIQARRKDAVMVAEFCDNRMEIAVRLKEMETAVDKEALQDAIYTLQLRNGEIAAAIKDNPEHYRVALERNRLGEAQVASAFAFHERRAFVASLTAMYAKTESIDPNSAFQLVDNIKTHYGHVCRSLPDKNARNTFLRAMERRADIHRRETALNTFGIEARALINTFAHYKKLDFDVAIRLQGLPLATSQDKKDLYQQGIDRDRLAFEFASHPNQEAMATHFAIKPERLAKHAQKYQDRMVVKAFAEMPASTKTEGNLARQSAAHRIKIEPKRYGIFVDEFLKDGWKSLNLENWQYKRRLTFASASPALKQSIQKVRRYKEAASQAYLQWQKAIKKSEKASPNKTQGFKQAQGLSWKLALLAHEIMGSIHEHTAALAMEKVDTAKLYQQARHVDYLTRYRRETRDTLKLRMAKHIHANLKDFQAGLAVYGLYQDVKERALHFAYLQRIKEAAAPETKALIRLALEYQDKKVEAGILWSQAKTLKQLKIDPRGLALQARHVMSQRNAAAHTLLTTCTQKDELIKAVTGIDLDVSKLMRESSQHLAEAKILNYLSSEPEARGTLAKELLANKAGYHLLFGYNIAFETLKKEAWLLEPRTLPQDKALGNSWNIERITNALMANPVATYRAILGEPKEEKPNHLRYSGGLIVSTQGSHAGKWYSFTEEAGGTPLSALQKYRNLSFPEALAEGAALAGLSEYEAKLPDLPKHKAPETPKSENFLLEEKIKRGIASAQSIWNSTINASGTLGERYFVEHRKLNSIEGMDIRYWPKGALWVDFDTEGKPLERPNKIPAAVIAARNAKGQRPSGECPACVSR